MTPATATEKRHIWEQCLDCAGTLYGATPPNGRYREATARMLFGTAAVESDFLHMRQTSVPFASTIGGFSFFQVETATASYLLKWARQRPELAQRAAQWLFRDVRATADDLTKLTRFDLETGLRLSNRFGMALARLKYFTIPAPIPATLEEQADYWLRFYNGEGCLKYHSRDRCLRKYVDKWRRHCEPVLLELAA